MDDSVRAALDPEMRRAKRYREAVTDLRSDVAPRLLPLLDEVPVSEAIEDGLRRWLAALTAPEQSDALAPTALLEAYGGLSILYLCAFAYRGVPPRNKAVVGIVDLVLTPRTEADPEVARRAQLRIAEIIAHGHGQEEMARLAAIHARERATLRRMARMVHDATR